MRVVPESPSLGQMRARVLVAVLVAALCGCGASAPDETSKLIAERYADCMPGLKAADVHKISEKRYAVSGKYTAAWSVVKSNTGKVITVPADDASVRLLESYGCS